MNLLPTNVGPDLGVTDTNAPFALGSETVCDGIDDNAEFFIQLISQSERLVENKISVIMSY